MQVEVFEVEELNQEAQKLAADSEALEIAERLGLAGQLSLTNKDTVTRTPYRKMKADEYAIYELLCPEKCKLVDYADGVIPLRVMQVAAHADSLGFFEEFWVWYPKNADVKDPILVAIRTVPMPGFTWKTTEYWLLARWGEMLEPLNKLAEQAKEIYLSRKTLEFKKKKSDAIRGLETIEEVKEMDFDFIKEALAYL